LRPKMARLLAVFNKIISSIRLMKCWLSLTGQPPRASSMAGSNTTGRDSRPACGERAHNPAILPGTATEPRPT